MGGVVSIPVSGTMLSQAEAYAASIGQHREGLASQRIYKANRDVIGSIGEMAFAGWLRDVGITWGTWSDQDLRAKGDNWDFKINNITFDIKTTEANRQYGLLSDQIVRLEEHQIKKPIGLYVFVHYRSDQMRAYILGFCSKRHFMQLPSCRKVYKGEPLFKGSTFLAQGTHYAAIASDLHQIGELELFLKGVNE